VGRLFWKFFLTFWLALLFAGVGVGTAVWLRHQNEQNTSLSMERPDALIDGRHAEYLLELAQRAYEYGGVKELGNFLGSLRDLHMAQVYAIDEQGRDVLQRELPAELIQHARSLLDQNQDAVRQLTATDGHRYLLFAVMTPHGFPGHDHGPPGMGPGGGPGDDFGFHPPLPPNEGFDRNPGHPPGPPPDQPPSTLLPILAGLFASLLFSFVLAWYFAKPIRSLRRAFAGLAEGNLDVRIGTAMGRRHDELADLGQDFDHMAAQIDGLVNSQQRLLHDVSHELRSPLARIQAAIGLAMQQPEKQQTMLARIERESQRISDLVGELLLLTRMEAGVSDGDVHEFDIGGLLEDIVEDARFEAYQLGVSIQFAGMPETQVRGRGELLRRAIENVLRNALQHCKPAGIVAIYSGFDQKTRHWQLTADDQGSGVPPSDLSAIFEPFFRSGKVKSNSTGLGLAIAYRAIAAHGGHIQALNRPEGGLRIRMDITFQE
jgi:two-component system OmpR family sensor kinase